MPTRPRATEEVRIPLRVSGYRFSPGHRIRLTILTSYWPVLWPSPLPGEIRVHHGPAAPSRLILPVLPDGVATPGVPAYRTDPVVMRDVGSYEEDAPEWRIEEDVLRGTVTVTIFDGGGSTQEDGSRLYSSERLVLTASDARPGARPARERRGLSLGGLRSGGGHLGPRADRIGRGGVRRDGDPGRAPGRRAVLQPRRGPSGSRATWSEPYCRVPRAALAISALTTATDTLASVPSR